MIPVAALLAGVCWAQPAAAQETTQELTGTALDRYEPAPYGDVLMGVPSAHVWGEVRVAAGAMINYAHRPLVLFEDVDGGGERGAIVGHQLLLYASGSVELLGRIKLDVAIPFTVSQGGDDPAFGGSSFSSPSGFAMSDVRGGARVEVLEQKGYWPAAALAFDMWFPSGNNEAFTGTGLFRYAPSVIVSGDYDEFVWTAMVSRRFQQPTDADLLGSEVRFGVGGGPRFGDLLLSAEVFGNVLTESEERRNALTYSPTVNLEAHVGGSYDIGPLRLRLAAGPGLTRGAGTPDFRLVSSVGFITDAIEPKSTRSGEVRDGEGGAGAGGAGAGGAEPVPAPKPVTPPAPPPPQDSDGDGVLDADDACPRRFGDPQNEQRPGCPKDTDQDGAPDAEDACPKVPGVRSSDPKQDGCPPDSDGDGLRDPDDACPNERGEKTDDPKTTGCPKAVRVVGQQIVILQKVEFETNKAVILSKSESLLQQVADVLNDHPEIVRVAVEGHTDSTGTKRRNTILSQKRALSVMQWLIDHGVDSRRLEARGFGPRRPIADNRKAAGRAKNRRVEFQILKRDPRGEQAWEDGTVIESKGAGGEGSAAGKDGAAKGSKAKP